MPSFRKTLGIAMAGLAAVSSALPALPKLSKDQMRIYEHAKRQNEAAAALGLNDIDILQFALTLEWLEATFYQQGFAKFPATDFQALGLDQQQIDALLKVGKTEQEHVVLLQSAIAQAGVQPVQPCTYKFGFTDAAGMVATAAVLENVGVSAYLGAAALLSSGSILTTAGSILTVEARHQTFIRAASGSIPVPQAFDTPLSPRQVFSLAAPFIESCPEGSNLILTAFPALAMPEGASPKAVAAGATVQLRSDAAASATHCAFTTGGIPGGTTFTPFDQAAGCVVPEGLAGITYVNLASAAPLNGVLTDDIIVAGPMVMQVS
ncbi:Ferritin/ribonucleotide reductase-like-protein [Thermothelomyces thermophilus ATCC 42464]|uniref:Ferritin/ribonucleotide reductase-like-protein n=1 Tax=Thermothelomyces thermophilus (strain ATCC 42464 / BCRC 31852 / DSM 1799) TaxID=573729 RepID=G2Q9L1_THET4|nr:Ferritin/ribonucleotide reductase-like-protein [Thermothelomyces thermophilus ATCC 42464]AEO56470.1 Ferritin/ribonucleotide reductase-like-protein [Thermothelomyces thermophilus ATCC 42464]